MGMVTTTLAITLLVLSTTLFLLFRTLRWYMSLEGWGTMLSIWTLWTFSWVFLVDNGTFGAVIGLLLGIVVCVTRIISIYRGKQRVRNRFDEN